MTKSASLIAKTLLAWYRKRRRILPRRENPDPYGSKVIENHLVLCDFLQF
jgi:adenine-specific DNA glycosylase